MAFGNLTKQLAAQALGSTVDNVLDSRTDKPASPEQPDLCATVVGQVQAMQKALNDLLELAVHYQAGAERIRIFEIYVPSPQVLVLSGIDNDKNMTRIISPVGSVQLICKVMRVQPNAKPIRINFIAPKPKPEQT
jgi:hypothetical protein